MKLVILITGGSRGLGKTLSERFCQEGHIVYAGIRSQADLLRLSGDWQATFTKIQPLKLDLGLADECRGVIQKIVEVEGRLDVLINCAAKVLVGPAESFSDEDFLAVLESNLLGPFRLTRAVLPVMRKQGGGRIINVTSLNGLVSLPNFSLYSASKFALEAFGQAVRYEALRSGIWVTNVAPGAIKRKGSPQTVTPHVPVRERFSWLKRLLPMLSEEQVVQTTIQIVGQDQPPARVLLGRDTHLAYFLQRFLPERIWDRLLKFLYSS